MAAPEVVPSKNKVNLAGDQLAAAQRALVDLSPDERLESTRIVDAWRQLHAEPLAWVTEKLTTRVAPVATQCVVAQRLKRMPQIIKKLARYETMNLTQMQDLGGCRIVMARLQHIDEAATLIRSYGRNRWRIRHEADYRTEGRPDTAYRALHVIVVRRGQLIEIQLRTMRQHVWAEAVERVTALSDHDVKEGRAPEEFLEYFKLASDGFYLLDRGESISKRHADRFRNLHATLGPYVAPER